MSILEKITKIEECIKSKPQAENPVNTEVALIKSYQNKTPIEYRIGMDSYWKKRLFLALCNIKGIKTYRYHRQKQTTVNVKVSKDFMDNHLWPEFLKYSDILDDSVDDIIKSIIEKMSQKNSEIIYSKAKSIDL